MDEDGKDVRDDVTDVMAEQAEQAGLADEASNVATGACTARPAAVVLAAAAEGAPRDAPAVDIARRDGHIFVLPEEIEQATFLAALREGIRALHERDRARERRDRLPANVGKPWTSAHDVDLLAAFDAGMPLDEIAKRLQRTRIGVRTRLERHGRLSPA